MFLHPPVSSVTARLATSVLLAILVAATPAQAKDITGHWEGRMEPTNLSAEIGLDLQRGGSSWKARLSFRTGPDGGALPVEELTVAGDSVLVRTRIEGADVSFALRLQDDLLLGLVRVTESGRVLAEGPAGLALASDTNAKDRLASWLNAQGVPIAPALRTVVIERSLELLSDNYVFSDRAQRAIADVRARMKRGEYDSIITPARLADVLGRNLADATDDRHLHVKVGAVAASDPLSDTTETEANREQLRREARAEGFGIGKPRVLDGNVGYLPFHRFLRAEFAGDALAAAMRDLANTKALILDLRQCHGGDPVMVALAASWLFDGRPRLWNSIQRRRGDATTQFWTAAWLPGARYVGKPVYVLTAHQTFSAPESFAYELQQTGRATIVGETTGGGAHSGAWFPIEDRFSIFIPLSRYVSAVSGGDWEGTGVKPDVACDASEALEKARRLAAQEIRPK